MATGSRQVLVRHVSRQTAGIVVTPDIRDRVKYRRENVVRNFCAPLQADRPLGIQSLHRSGYDIVCRQTQRRNSDAEALTNEPQRQFIALGPCDDAYARALGPELPALRFAAESQNDGLSLKIRD